MFTLPHSSIATSQEPRKAWTLANGEKAERWFHSVRFGSVPSLDQAIQGHAGVCKEAWARRSEALHDLPRVATRAQALHFDAPLKKLPSTGLQPFDDDGGLRIVQAEALRPCIAFEVAVAPGHGCRSASTAGIQWGSAIPKT